ncbi:MAG TPA: hypothetical protein VMI75_30525 [Polyangiaceae bacterium]|nr:hypothetical protein [Polyangiaceae bacterium]
MALLFLPRLASAHTPGVSTAEFDVAPDGHVDAHLVFASAEPLNGTPLRDDDLRAFVLDGVDVTADGSRCDPTWRGSYPTEGDGLALDASYACGAGASEVAVTLYYLSALPAGHREVARIVASGASIEGVLTGDRRALSLRLPAATAGAGGGAPAARAARKARQLTVLTAAFAAFMVALFVWRWRATRKR